MISAGIIFGVVMAVFENKKKYKFLSSNRLTEIIENELALRGIKRVFIGEEATEKQQDAFFHHQKAMCLVRHVTAYPEDKFLRFAHLAINEPFLFFAE